MRLSTSLAIFGIKPNAEYTPAVESLKRCKAAGFNVLDASFTASMRGSTELVKDCWQELVYELRNEADKLGVEFSQSHPVFIPGGEVLKKPRETQVLFHEMMRRSIIASSILGVKWAVLHPIKVNDSPDFDIHSIIKGNLDFYAPVVELAIKHNVGIVYENILQPHAPIRFFPSLADELAALVDAYNDSSVGACWDFGHGNFLYKDQTIALRSLGKRLKATHVADNCGISDDHMLPFHGSIDWLSIMPVLTEIGYEGDFTYEANREFSRLPDHIKDSLAKVAYEVGMYCLSLA